MRQLFQTVDLEKKHNGGQLMEMPVRKQVAHMRAAPLQQQCHTCETKERVSQFENAQSAAKPCIETARAQVNYSTTIRLIPCK